MNLPYQIVLYTYFCNKKIPRTYKSFFKVAVCWFLLSSVNCYMMDISNCFVTIGSVALEMNISKLETYPYEIHTISMNIGVGRGLYLSKIHSPFTQKYFVLSLVDAGERNGKMKSSIWWRYLQQWQRRIIKATHTSILRITKTQRHITQYIKDAKFTKGDLAFSSCPWQLKMVKSHMHRKFCKSLGRIQPKSSKRTK